RGGLPPPGPRRVAAAARPPRPTPATPGGRGPTRVRHPPAVPPPVYPPALGRPATHPSEPEPVGSPPPTGAPPARRRPPGSGGYGGGARPLVSPRIPGGRAPSPQTLRNRTTPGVPRGRTARHRLDEGRRPGG